MTTIALSTGSLYTYGIARVFDLAAEAGFDAIEIMVDHRWDSRQPDYVKRLSQASGLPVAAVHSPFVPYVPGWPHHALSRLRLSAALARELGAPIVVSHLPLRLKGARLELFGFEAKPLLLPIFLPSLGSYHRLLTNGLEHFEEVEGVRIGVENMPAKRLLGWRADIYSLNKPADLARMPHLTLDTTHLGTWGLDPLVIYERWKDRVVHIHMSNFNGREHRLLEDGHLHLGKMLRYLTVEGYEGAVSVELCPEVLQAESEARARAHLRATVQFCRKHLAP